MSKLDEICSCVKEVCKNKVFAGVSIQLTSNPYNEDEEVSIELTPKVYITEFDLAGVAPAFLVNPLVLSIILRADISGRVTAIFDMKVAHDTSIRHMINILYKVVHMKKRPRSRFRRSDIEVYLDNLAYSTSKFSDKFVNDLLALTEFVIDPKSDLEMEKRLINQLMVKYPKGA